jgi:hypothetical protein
VMTASLLKSNRREWIDEMKENAGIKETDSS